MTEPLINDLEFAVLGELYIDVENRHLYELEDTDFAIPKAREIYRLLKKYPDMRDDLMKIKETIKTEKLDNITEYLFIEIMNQAIGVTLLPTHIDLLKKRVRRNALLKIYQDGGGEFSEEDIESLHRLTKPENKDHIVVKSMTELAVEFADELDARKIIFEKGVLYPTGFPILDDYTGGLMKHNIFVIGGRTSLGKTSFMMNIIINLLKEKNVPCLYFTCEMHPIELMDRIVASQANIEAYKIKYARLTPDELNNIVGVLSNERLSNAKLHIYYAPSLDVPMIRSAIEEYKPEVIVVDHIQLLKVQGQTRAQAIEDAMYEIKGLANEFDVAVMAGSQIARESEKQGKQTKQELSNLYFKGSGGIEDCATVAGELKLDKDEHKENPTWSVNFELSKNRFGRIGNIPYTFYREYLTFSERVTNE